MPCDTVPMDEVALPAAILVINHYLAGASLRETAR
jgi:hypothetical protein